MLGTALRICTDPASGHPRPKETHKPMARPQRRETSAKPEPSSAAASESLHLISEGELCLDLINSTHFDYRGRKEEPQDTLEQVEWVTAFSQHWHLPVTFPPDAFALAALRTLRALLRNMFEALAAGQPITDAHLEALNVFLALTPMQQRVQRTASSVHLQMVELQTGWTAVLTRIAASWVDLLARTPAARLRVCANPACHWVFLDQSHNLSRRWCRQWACGNVIKVRQYRARRTRTE